jgi:hypothetical protein
MVLFFGICVATVNVCLYAIKTPSCGLWYKLVLALVQSLVYLMIHACIS